MRNSHPSRKKPGAVPGVIPPILIEGVTVNNPRRDINTTITEREGRGLSVWDASCVHAVSCVFTGCNSAGVYVRGTGSYLELFDCVSEDSIHSNGVAAHNGAEVHISDAGSRIHGNCWYGIRASCETVKFDPALVCVHGLGNRDYNLLWSQCHFRPNKHPGSLLEYSYTGNTPNVGPGGIPDVSNLSVVLTGYVHFSDLSGNEP